MPIQIGKAPNTGGRGKFYSPQAGATDRLTLLCNPDQIVSCEQYEIWDIQPAVIWVANDADDPGVELHLSPSTKSFMPVLVNDDPEPKIWAMRKSQHIEVINIYEANDSEPIVGQVIQVKRTGTGLETRYTVTATSKRIPESKLPKDIPTAQNIIDTLNVREPAEIKRDIMTRLGMQWPDVVEMFTQKWESDKAKKANDRRNKKGASVAADSPAEGDVEAL